MSAGGTAVYVVEDGAATRVDDGQGPRLPAGVYGADWILVEAPSASRALSAASAYDAGRGARDGDAMVYDRAHALGALRTALRSPEDADAILDAEGARAWIGLSDEDELGCSAEEHREWLVTATNGELRAWAKSVAGRV